MVVLADFRQQRLEANPSPCLEIPLAIRLTIREGRLFLKLRHLVKPKPTCAPCRMLHAAGSDRQAARRVEERSRLVRDGSGDLRVTRGVEPTGGVNIENGQPHGLEIRFEAK